ncbi:vacuolar protein 14 C-terminal Fig4p binding-domain-containing protein [Sporodiniella umbellata]|nr:vacuolar protein 14 C-terminal Fig4p binding-domain-containing protein [Sporodiniella umbellata]
METSLFSPNLIKGLTDKAYGARKNAALQVEKLVREHEKSEETVTQIVDALVQEFVYSNDPFARYGGLIGLAATSIALGQASLLFGVSKYLDIIVPPILTCFSNQDQKVRYYACESMYNIAKVAKGEVLRFFNSMFDALCKLSADSEVSVKNGAELLDRLIRDIVSELATTYESLYSEPFNPPESGQELFTPSSLPRNTAFSLPRFIPLLSQRIYVRNSASRQFLVSWMCVLDSIPDLELVSFLPEFLDGLIRCLNDSSGDVRTATGGLLQDFLMEIKEAASASQLKQQYEIHNPIKDKKKESKQESTPESAVEAKLVSSERGNGSENDVREIQPESQSEKKKEVAENANPTVLVETKEVYSENDGHGKGTYVPGQGVIVQYAEIVEILVNHLSSAEEEIQKTALLWINAFIDIAKSVIIQFTPEIIKEVLPCLAHSVTDIRLIALDTNQKLQKIVLETSIVPAFLESTSPEPTSSVSDPSGSPYQLRLTRKMKSAENAGDLFDYQATVANLRLQFLNQHEETRVASLDWLLMLHKKAPNKILMSDDGTFPALLKTLSDSSEEVVRRDLQLLAQISFYSDQDYFRGFMVSLLSLFSTDRRLLETRGSLIIRQLCMSLDPERIYCTMADILEADDDLEFASIMIQNLNIILITASELSDLRKRLRNLDNKDNQRLFNTLYKSWCHNAISAFSLCLLAQTYEHASNMLLTFSEFEITVNLLIQVDKLVQLLESPVFTYLRLQLLEPEKYPYLFKCLYGILMLLPQSSAFSTLRNRLSSVSSLGFLHVLPKNSMAGPTTMTTTSTEKRQTSKTKMEDINAIKYQELLQHFKLVQSRHEKQRKQSLQNVARSSTFNRTRRSKAAYNEGVVSPGGSQGSIHGRDENMGHSNNKGLGILSANNVVNIPSNTGASGTTSGIRNGMASLGLTSSSAISDSANNNMSLNNNHAKSAGTTAGGTASRMMTRRTRR